ncbi:ABC transporter substrate-binding protein [Gordonia humi]|uniref:Iron complex transport system substrate-binding protein n=1 Tax=Gordonia humi TaxID=686429 RepID=A0A840EQH8_9ACTN|nr:ABC transporter substrate-binding protein [Gordonia humi]MBB4133962.1 iron complex transport system substrate-binding protein [Gordonia humi]
MNQTIPNRAPRRRRALTTAVLIALVALLAGVLGACGSEDADADTGSTFAMENAFGTSEIPTSPKRILAVSEADLNAAQVLGVTPSVVAEYKEFPFNVWTTDALKKEDADPERIWTGTSYEIRTEDVVKARPDLILAVGSWYMDDTYQQLSKIAPVVTFPKPFTSPSDVDAATFLRTVAKALGKEDEAEKVIKDTDAKSAKWREDNPTVVGKTAALAVQYIGGGISNDSVEPYVANYLKMFGLVPPPSTDPSQPSLEDLSSLDRDILILNFYADRKEITENSVFKNLAVVRDGRTIENKALSEAAGTPTYLNMNYVLDDTSVRDALRSAAAKVRN